MTKYTTIVLFAFLIFCTSCEELDKVFGVDTTSQKEGVDTGKTALNIKDIDFKSQKIEYPEVFRDSTVVEEYFGKKIADPYRWLEDDNSAETKDWVLTQNKVTNDYISEIPFHGAIKERLTALWNYEKFSTPSKKGGKYYFSQNNGLQNQSVLYVQSDLSAEPEVVLDPNTFSTDGTSSLSGYSISKDGKYLAYLVSEAGSDWRTVYVKDLEENELLEDKISWVKFSGVSWQGEGFYYSRYPEPSEQDALSGSNEFHQVYYHQVGTPQSEDKLIFADRSNPSRNFYANISDDERFCLLSMSETTSGNGLLFKDLSSESNAFVAIEQGFKDDYYFIDNIDDKLLVLTNNEADNWRLVQISTKHPDRKFWEVLIPESEDVLKSVNVLDNKLVATYIHDAKSLVKIFDLNGREMGKIKLPEMGTVGGFSGDKNEENAFFSFQSFLRPTTIYKVNLRSLQSEIFKTPKLDFNPDDFVTKQVFYKSYDGTKIPMFITHKKDLKPSEKTPTLLYGYGGFDISYLPKYQTQRILLLEKGGVYAVANIRGGGEYGKKWHEGGIKMKKQNVFDDFQSAAEHLISNGYTSNEKLAIEGRSNGGLLVGACITQRPDLYTVAFPIVGVLDMLRYHKFTIGAAWAGDYGRSDESQEMFDYLQAYSPLHNVSRAKYPATLITTADHDDRVVPAHSFKFASELQQKQIGDKPVLIRVDTGAGHGSGKPISMQIAESTDMLAFLFWNLKHW